MYPADAIDRSALTPTLSRKGQKESSQRVDLCSAKHWPFSSRHCCTPDSLATCGQNNGGGAPAPSERRLAMDMKTSPLSMLKDPSLLKTDALIGGEWIRA